MATNKKVLEGKKILFVEDDLFFANMISLKLSDFGGILQIVGTGKEALQALEKEKPDLIILDIMLPGGMDGFAVLEKVKADEKARDVPVVIVSNLGRPEDIEKGMRLGAFRYLTKALVIPEEIIDNLESAITSRKM